MGTAQRGLTPPAITFQKAVSSLGDPFPSSLTQTPARRPQVPVPILFQGITTLIRHMNIHTRDNVQ